MNQPASPSSSRRVPIVAIGIGTIIAAAIIAAAVWFFTIYISKSDYQAVADGYNKLADINKTLDVTGDVMAESPTQANIDKATNSTNEYDAQLQSIGRLRAVQKDADLAAVYRSFIDQQSEYVRAERAAIALMRASSSCREAADRGQKPACLAKLSEAEAIGSPVMSEFARGFSTAVEKDDYLGMFEVSNTYAKGLKALQDKTEQSSTTFRDAINRKLT